MDSTIMSRQYKLQKWTEIIRTCRSSGLTVAKWCEENSVTPSNYYYWLKRVRQNACDTLPAVNNHSNTIVPLVIEESITPDKIVSDQSYALRLIVSGYTLEFSNDASPILIENALKVLNHVR